MAGRPVGGVPLPVCGYLRRSAATVEPATTAAATQDSIAGMDVVDRLKASISAAIDDVPGDIRDQVRGLLSPESLAIMAAFIAAQAVGLGELADAAGLIMLAWKIGGDVTVVARDLYRFVDLTVNAHSTKDLAGAGRHLADAVVLAGVDTIMTIVAAKAHDTETPGRPSATEPEAPTGTGTAEPARTSTTSAPSAPAPASTTEPPAQASTAESPAGSGTAGPSAAAASGSADLLAARGILRSSAEGFQAVADEFDIVIKVRPTNTASIPLLEDGAMAKPELIKWKTINHTDTLLGAPSDAIGKAGMFDPTMPDEATMRSLTPKEQARITERFAKRAGEYADFMAHQDKWKPLIDNNEMSIENGVVRLGDPRTGALRDVAGDHDLYEITHSDGSPLSADERALVIDQLRSMNINVEHSTHVTWAEDSPTTYSSTADASIRGQHGSSEPLVVFTPRSAPGEAFGGTEVTGPARTSGPGDRFRKLKGNVTATGPAAR